MSFEAEKRLAQRSLEMWASNAADNPDEIFSKDYVNHQEPYAAGSVASVGLDGWMAIVTENHTAFSDFQVEILMQIAEGDLVATRWRFSATQTGTYLGHPPTGKRATWTGVQIDRIADGKIIESWVDWDKYAMFDQLGVLK